VNAAESDLGELSAAASELPADDPLRGGDTKNLRAGTSQTGKSEPTAAPPTSGQANIPEQQTKAVMIVDSKTLRVPSLIGLPMRKVIELASAAGLELQVSGNGTVREQAPASGTMVAPGTQIVVRCGR